MSLCAREKYRTQTHCRAPIAGIDGRMVSVDMSTTITKGMVQSIITTCRLFARCATREETACARRRRSAYADTPSIQVTHSSPATAPDTAESVAARMIAVGVTQRSGANIGGIDVAEITKIAWSHSTFSPWIGCTKIGPGCDQCYAHAADHRFTGGKHWGAGAPRRPTSSAYWRKPLLWNEKAQRSGKPWRVFCASQADVFDNEADPELRASLFRLIKATPNLTWLLLTKRIGNAAAMLPDDWISVGMEQKHYPNVWLGITVVTQAEVDRDWRKLFELGPCVKFLSVEPQIEEISLIPMVRQSHLPDWVICGGESAQLGKCRPFDARWAMRLREECDQFGAAFFMKQLGSKAHFGSHPMPYTGKGDNPAEWPNEIQVREFPR